MKTTSTYTCIPGQQERMRHNKKKATGHRGQGSKDHQHANGTSKNATNVNTPGKTAVQEICKNYLVPFTVAAILVPLFAISWQYYRSYTDELKVGQGHILVEKQISVPGHQQVSLHEPFTMDYDVALREREVNMQKYDYKYSRWGVDKRENLTLQEYYDIYDGKWPVVITDVIPKWQAFNWSRDFFNENYGKERVTMKAVDSSLEEAVSLALPLELFYKNTHEAFPNRWTYIEDELFIPMRPQLKKDIGENIYLEEDLFKLFPDEIRPWDAMLLWGTKYSRSSLHIDPYNWTGTNAVIRGRKRWKLYPPGQDHFLNVIRGRRSGFPLDCYKYNSPIDAYDPNLNKYTRFKHARAIEFDQLPGELLLIPTGWFHQAFNLEETIAVSSQVMNRNNVRTVLEEILKVDNLPRSSLPHDIDLMTPGQQVKTVMFLLPRSILARGKAVTEDILFQIQHGYEKLRTMRGPNH